MSAAYTLIFSDYSLIFLVFALAIARCKWTLKIWNSRHEALVNNVMHNSYIFQVITWFQNRRAKLKRDLEELKSDITAAKTTMGLPQEMTGVFGSLEELQLFQKQNGLKKTGTDKMKGLSVSVSSTAGSSVASPPSSCGSLSPAIATSSPPNVISPSAASPAALPLKQGPLSPTKSDHMTPIDHVTSPALLPQHSPISNASDSPKKPETSSSLWLL